MIGLLQLVAGRAARAGNRRRAGTKTAAVPDPQQLRRLLLDPHLWQLWMPGVLDLAEQPRPPRPGARYRVRLRQRVGRLGFGGVAEGHVVIECWGETAFAWQLVVAEHVERYALALDHASATLTVDGGEDPAVALAQLLREAAPLDAGAPPAAL